MRRLSREVQVTVLVVVLAVAGVIALWPRPSGDGSAVPAAGVAASSQQTGPEPARQDLARQDPARQDPARQEPARQDPARQDPARQDLAQAESALAAARRHAGLRPCPQPAPGVVGRGPLAGVRVPCLGGPGSVEVAAALAGRPALLNVWASWCGPCREEMPALDAYAREPGAIAVLGVDGTDEPVAALELSSGLGVHYPSVADPDGRLRAALAGPPLLPASYLLLPDGTVTRIVPPVVFRSPAEVHQVLTRYLRARR